MPAAQCNVLDERENRKDRNARQRNQYECREHAGNIEAVARFDDAVGEAGAGARRAGRGTSSNSATGCRACSATSSARLRTMIWSRIVNSVERTEKPPEVQASGNEYLMVAGWAGESQSNRSVCPARVSTPESG